MKNLTITMCGEQKGVHAIEKDIKYHMSINRKCYRFEQNFRLYQNKQRPGLYI
jgi:hypothetical protein